MRRLFDFGGERRASDSPGRQDQQQQQQHGWRLPSWESITGAAMGHHPSHTSVAAAPQAYHASQSGPLMGGGDSSPSVVALERSRAIQEIRMAKELSVVMALNDEGFTIEQVEQAVAGQIKVTVPRVMLKDDLNGDISFTVAPSQQFPFKPPHVFCLTRFCFPSLADGRDLVYDVIRKDWVPSTTYASIIRQLPGFIDRVLEVSREKGPQAMLFGFFDGSVSIDRYLRDPNASVMPCQKVDQLSHRSVPRFVVLTEGALLVLEVTQNSSPQRFGEIRSWAHLSQLTSVTRKKNTGVVTLRVRGYGAGQGDKIQTFVFEDPETFMAVLQHHMASLGVDSFNANANESLENVSVEIIRMRSIVDDPNAQEPLSISFVQRLMALYQKQIELYSARSDPAYETALQSLKEFLQNPRVSAVLDTHHHHQHGQQQQHEHEQHEQHRGSDTSSSRHADHIAFVPTVYEKKDRDQRSSVHVESAQAASEEALAGPSTVLPPPPPPPPPPDLLTTEQPATTEDTHQGEGADAKNGGGQGAPDLL
ncbi:unnamed protein product [Vitrella brassicaformis CCMP3155]|uniref:Uncharacterized protein n=1 Tax=Vitrella brassicaformis (strain CCMP3155) TaxID=1169540 RepID=A0A0G4GAV0_VITBC|nr:unnamed protein product [Vitrella brassicaformis CCMP3155]|eukprot:CEM26215.1 unnamed protein product [Vitrella brassicaformis CCMP3155]